MRLNFEHFIHDFGALGVALGAGLEGESAVVLGGALARSGAFSPVAAVLGAMIGSFFADQIFFALGRSQRNGRFVRRVSAKPAFARALTMIERHTVAFCLAFRFVYGFRIVGPVAIGTSSVPIRTFLILNAISATVWAIIFTAIGWRFGRAFEHLLALLFTPLHLMIAAAAVVVIGLSVFAVRRWRREGPANSPCKPEAAVDQQP